MNRTKNKLFFLLLVLLITLAISKATTIMIEGFDITSSETLQVNADTNLQTSENNISQNQQTLVSTGVEEEDINETDPIIGTNQKSENKTTTTLVAIDSKNVSQTKKPKPNPRKKKLQMDVPSSSYLSPDIASTTWDQAYAIPSSIVNDYFDYLSM